MLNPYRQKPVVVEAILYDWNDIEKCADEAQDEICDFMNANIFIDSDDEIEIETPSGVLHAVKGDYIIKGVNGEFYPCKPDIFAKTYEQVNERVCTAPKDDRELTDDEIKRIRETGSLCDCHEFVDSDDSELPNPITPEFLESQIVSVTYTQLGKTLTHCQIEVKNGFVFTGESACADPENFDEVIGQKIAFENAKSKMWMPYGFLLKQQLAE